MKYQFCVITRIPNPNEDEGNLACALVYGLPKELQAVVLLRGRIEVFALGEIIVVNGSDREIGGRMRKPSKWMVESEYFDDIESAVAKSLEVTEAAT